MGGTTPASPEAWERERGFARNCPMASAGERGETIRAEQNYFAGQEHRMNYEEMADRGWPIGSGAVESACRQQQCRFKRPGQFWTAKGLRNLTALTEAKHNFHWEELWESN
jgi:hypothetical protein